MAHISETASRRQILRTAAGAAGGAVGLAVLKVFSPEAAAARVTRKDTLSWADGKYQTYPRLVMAANPTVEGTILQQIDLGTLGPDVDTIAGVDFPGDFPTNATIIHMPENGVVLETRVVFIKRKGLTVVQLAPALGGDRFDVYRIADHGGDEALDAIARKHAQQSAREHQKVVYIGDLRLFEQQWGQQEAVLLRSMIRAQRPALDSLGIPSPDFVNPRKFSKAGEQI